MSANAASSSPLNAQQRRVVGRLSGETFVSAGAGSGKTRVLAERFASLVLDRDPAESADALRRVLLLTFTDKAAGELGERVRRVLLERGHPELARAVDRAWISTIHGFCGRIVRRHAIELGIDPGFSVIVDPQAGVVRQAAFEDAATRLVALPDVAELLDVHGVDAVRRGVASALDQVRAMGQGPAGLRVPGPNDCRAELASAVGALPTVTAAYSGLRPLAFVEHNRPVLAGLQASFEELGDLADAELARGILSLAPATRLKRPGNTKGPEKDATLEAIEVIDRLVTSAVESVTAAHAAALRRLTVAYGEAYEERKTALRGLDFEDLQLLAARVFEQVPGAARGYARRFAAAMIDEFQDTNALQLRVIGPITDGRLCVVGDENQSIYGFRFADVDVFRERHRAQLAEDPDGSCALQVNYRTHPDLLATLNDMFGRDPFFADDYLRLEPGRTEGWHRILAPGTPRTEILLVDRAGWEDVHWRDVEARVLARRVAGLVAEGVEVGDVVVLLRQMTYAQTYVQALRDEGLGVYAESSGGFFAAPEVADMRALLATLANPGDEGALVALLAGGLGGVSDDGLYRMTHGPDAAGGLWAALRGRSRLGLNAHDDARCGLVRETVESLRRERGRRRLADTLLDAAAALAPGGGGLSRGQAWANMRKVARIAAEYERFASGDPGAFLRHLDEREVFVKREAATAVQAEGGQAVRVMTVHAAKGLEFPVVAVADLGHGSFKDAGTIAVQREADGVGVTVRLPRSYGEDLPLPPAFEVARESARQRSLEEDKRVFYVACTRAEEYLILSGAADLAKPPGGELAMDWVRTAVGTSDPPRSAGVRLGVVTADGGAPPAPERGHAASEALVSGSEIEAPCHADNGDRRSIPSADVPLEGDLSYTALALYESCPRRFLAERVLALGTASADPEGGPRGFGLAVHAALQLSALGREPDARRLDALARFHGLPEGERSRLAAAVATFRQSAAAQAMRDRAARPEAPFATRVGDGTLVGTFDLLAMDGGEALVVDYKTGASELDAESARRRYETQARVYAFALLASGASRVDVRFVEVERDGRETRFEFGPDDRAGLAADVTERFRRAASGAYPHRGTFDHGACSDCPISGTLCPVVRPGGKKRHDGAGADR